MQTPFNNNIIADFAYTYRDYAILPTTHRQFATASISIAGNISKNLVLNMPIVGSNMGHLGGRMAEKMAQLGGIGILSQDFRLQEILQRIRRVKTANPYFHMPIVLSPEDRAADALALMNKRHFDCVVIVGKERAPIGIATFNDVCKVPGWEQLKNFMQKNLHIVPDTISTEQACCKMIEQQIHHLPVVDNQQKLVGCLTPLDISLRLHNYKPALDAQGRLLVGAALSMKEKEGMHPLDLAQLYIEHGVDVLVLDVANGYLDTFVQFVGKMRRALGNDFPIIAGNVADYAGAMNLFAAGCDTIKVGIGPGGACTTRRETGVGVPQATAVFESLRACRNIARHLAKQQTDCYKYVLADGGIRNDRDLATAMIIGASAVMIGSLFAGTFESAFETEFINGEMWKRWRGNASSSAATYRRKEIYGEKYITEDLEHSEGEDGYVKVTGSVTHKIFQLAEGLKHYMIRCDADSIAAFQSKRHSNLRLQNNNLSSLSCVSQLKFADIYIKPQPSTVTSRKLVTLATDLGGGIELKLPYVALPANFIKKKICSRFAQMGGLGFLSRKRAHENIQRLVNRVCKVKSSHPYYFLPSIQERDEEIGKTIDFLNENAFSCVIIVKNVQSDWTPVGIATRNALLDRPRTDPLREVIKTNFVTVQEGIELLKASEIMLQRGIHHLPVVNNSGKLVGCITPRDITLRIFYRLCPNVDSNGRLRVGASLKADNNNYQQLLEDAITLERAGVDVLLIDTKDGYALPYIELLKKLRPKISCLLVASGVSTYEGARNLFRAGADIVKAGTRVLSVPYLEAISECARAAIQFQKSVISDDCNDIQHPRDSNLALLMGANAVGLCNILAPTYENAIQATRSNKKPQQINTPQLIHKTLHGVEYILEDLSAPSDVIQELPTIKESVINVVVRLLNGLRSSCTYSNAATLKEYQHQAIIGIQSPSGYWEGNPHAFSNRGAYDRQ